MSVSKLTAERFILTGALGLGSGFDGDVASSTFGDQFVQLVNHVAQEPLEFDVEKTQVLSVVIAHAFGQITEKSGRVSVSELTAERFTWRGAPGLSTGLDSDVSALCDS